ncbi:MAG: hypothetical protein AAGK32_01300 [Actinomycetota bacterium]
MPTHENNAARSASGPVTDLLDEIDDERLTEVLGLARTAWCSVPESRPNDALAAFLVYPDLDPSMPLTVVGERPGDTVIEGSKRERPRSGRAAFGLSIAAAAALFTAIGLGLGSPTPGDSDDSGSAAPPPAATEVTIDATDTTATGPNAAASSTTNLTGDRWPARIMVADAGTADVAVVGGLLALLAADPAPGWSVVDHETSDDSNMIDLSFRRGADRVELNVTVDDGRIRVRIQDLRTDTRTESYLAVGAVTGSESDEDAGRPAAGEASASVDPDDADDPEGADPDQQGGVQSAVSSGGSPAGPGVGAGSSPPAGRAGVVASGGPEVDDDDEQSEPDDDDESGPDDDDDEQSGPDDDDDGSDGPDDDNDEQSGPDGDDVDPDDPDQDRTEDS